MAAILLEQEIRLQRSDLFRRAPIARSVSREGRVSVPARAPGIHLSGILRYIVLEAGLIRYQEQVEEDELLLRMALGLAWEEFGVSLWPSIVWQPGELSDDGIWMNCDGLSLAEDVGESDSPGAVVIEEFKLTWRKSKWGKELLDEEWYWLHQARAYCRAWCAEQIRWHVCWVMGDYRGSGPQYRTYWVRFTPDELESTHRMLLANRERAIEKGYSEGYGDSNSTNNAGHEAGRSRN